MKCKLILIAKKYCHKFIIFSYNIVKSCWTDDPNCRPSFKCLALEFEKLLGNNVKYIELETNAFSNPNYCFEDEAIDEAAINKEVTDSTKQSNMQWGEPDPLDHLWRPPKITYDLQDCCNSCETATFSGSFQPPPGYDMPRPLLETHTAEQRLRYENDLRFPLNLRKTSNAETSLNNVHASYTMPVKRGRSYMDMTNKTLLCDNLDNDDFEKHISKTISFRFLSLLNLNEQDDSLA